MMMFLKLILMMMLLLLTASNFSRNFCLFLRDFVAGVAAVADVSVDGAVEADAVLAGTGGPGTVPV